ncbi:MAG: DUF4468 domain-containing protein [Bacteroidaceae bacterium]|nr:DUF4468 domain-containing protein [Bacteroidaceae bacterium]
MKKMIVAMLAVALPMMMQAQSEGLFARKAPKAANENMSAYAAKGAVPEVDGKVVFKDVIAATGKQKADIYTRLAQWASLRYEANSMRGNYTDADFFKNIEYSSVKTADKQSGAIQCLGAEELIFSVKPLAKNYTQAFYVLDLQVNDGQVEFCLHNLAFNVDQGDGKFDRVTAEDWISDKECINKKGELRRIPGKFRIETIDLVNELKKEISETINQ